MHGFLHHNPYISLGFLNVPRLHAGRVLVGHLDHLVHQAFGRRAALLGGLGARVDREDQQPLLKFMDSPGGSPGGHRGSHGVTFWENDGNWCFWDLR